jgi:hypothetical protein
MNIGMLWFDNDPKSEFNTKVQRAATYYHDKYGRTPNLCFVHPSMLGNDNITDDEPQTGEILTSNSGDLLVKTSTSVLPNHFWIGVNGKNGTNGS